MEEHAIIVADHRGVIRVWSPGAERLFGYDAPSAVGQTLDLIVPEAYRDRHWAGFRAAMISGKPKLDQPAANLPVLCRDGSVVRLPGRLVFLRDARNQPIGAPAIFGPSRARWLRTRPFPTSSRVLKYGECRGAKPLCRGSGGVPQIQFSTLGRGVANQRVSLSAPC